MFGTLYQYIAGANSENENIDMTSPVSTKWQKHALHEECFYLNRKHQANPPEPNSPDVYIVSRPAMTIFTRYYPYFKSYNRLIKSNYLPIYKSCFHQFSSPILHNICFYFFNWEKWVKTRFLVWSAEPIITPTTCFKNLRALV